MNDDETTRGVSSSSLKAEKKMSRYPRQEDKRAQRRPSELRQVQGVVYVSFLDLHHVAVTKAATSGAKKKKSRLEKRMAFTRSSIVEYTVGDHPEPSAP